MTSTPSSQTPPSVFQSHSSANGDILLTPTSIIESIPIPQTPQRLQGLRPDDMRPLNPEAPVPDFVDDLGGHETRDVGDLQSVSIVTDEEIARICQRPDGPSGPGGSNGSHRSRHVWWLRRQEARRHRRIESDQQQQEQLRQEQPRQRTIGMEQQLSPIGLEQRQRTPRTEERLPRSQYFEDFVKETGTEERGTEEPRPRHQLADNSVMKELSELYFQRNSGFVNPEHAAAQYALAQSAFAGRQRGLGHQPVLVQGHQSGFVPQSGFVSRASPVRQPGFIPQHGFVPQPYPAYQPQFVPQPGFVPHHSWVYRPTSAQPAFLQPSFPPTAPTPPYAPERSRQGAARRASQEPGQRSEGGGWRGARYDGYGYGYEGF